MPSSPFKFLTWDLLTLAPLAELPLTLSAFGEETNSHGGFTGYLQITDERLEHVAWEAGTKPGRTLIAAEFDGELIWGGILWTRNYKKTTGVLELGAAGWGSYFDKRIQSRDYTSGWLAKAAPMRVANTLFLDSQDPALVGPNAIKGFTIERLGELGSTASFSFPSSSPQYIGSMISQLSSMGPFGGFDYSYKVRYKPGTKEPELYVRMQVPFLGRKFEESDIVLRGQDCSDWEWPEDAGGEAWRILGVGSSGILEPVVDKHQEEEGVPLLESIVNSSVANTAFTTQQIAYGELFAKARPVVNPPLTIPLFDADDGGKPGWTQFKDFQLGDELKFLIDAEEGGGRNTDPRFPSGLEAIRRCTTWSAVVQPAGLSTLGMVLNESPLRVEFAEYAEPERNPEETKEEEEIKEEEREEKEKEETESEPETEEEAKAKEKAEEEAVKKAKEKRAKERKTVKEIEKGEKSALTEAERECLEDLCGKKACLDALCQAVEECGEP